LRPDSVRARVSVDLDADHVHGAGAARADLQRAAIEDLGDLGSRRNAHSQQQKHPSLGPVRGRGLGHNAFDRSTLLQGLPCIVAPLFILPLCMRRDQSLGSLYIAVGNRSHIATHYFGFGLGSRKSMTVGGCTSRYCSSTMLTL